MLLTCRYLPSGTSFLTTRGGSQTLTDKTENPNSRPMWKKFVITKPAFLAIFTILACITERESMSTDPLNFSIFSVIFEVIRQVDIFKQIFLSMLEIMYHHLWTNCKRKSSTMFAVEIRKCKCAIKLVNIMRAAFIKWCPFCFCSAYGNVGYSLGYSCNKLLRPDATCRDASYGFVGMKEGWSSSWWCSLGGTKRAL